MPRLESRNMITTQKMLKTFDEIEINAEDLNQKRQGNDTTSELSTQY